MIDSYFQFEPKSTSYTFGNAKKVFAVLTPQERREMVETATEKTNAKPHQLNLFALKTLLEMAAAQ